MYKVLLPLMALLLALVACTGETPVTEQTSSTDNDPVVVDTTLNEAPTTETAMEAEAPAEEVAVEDEAPAEEAAEAAIEDEAPAEESMAYNGPAWTQLELVNARTGEPFTLADFAGKTVFVEPMATWCSNCRAQQTQVVAAMRNLNPADFVFISLNIDPISDASLAQYAEDNGFTQLFAVATPELLDALTAQFGRSVVVAPSTPHFTLAPNGTVSGLSTGQHSADQIVTEVTTVHNS